LWKIKVEDRITALEKRLGTMEELLRQILSKSHDPKSAAATARSVIKKKKLAKAKHNSPKQTEESSNAGSDNQDIGSHDGKSEKSADEHEPESRKNAEGTKSEGSLDQEEYKSHGSLDGGNADDRDSKTEESTDDNESKSSSS
jgi:hypothetical protein